ncbi:MAG: transposase, partial [Synergistaceae bacterium]|nr:transposase [Synergistaceae bacterium]
MMGKRESQMQIIAIDIGALVPEKHLLKKIDRAIDFSFIYELAAPYYSITGRKSVDPVSMIKMLLVGFLYGIKSERRLVEDVGLNLAYRWFCGFDLMDKIPDHSLFSQNRRRRFTDSAIFRDIFNKIVRLCVEKGVVTGETAMSDGTFIPANVAKGSLLELTQEIEMNAVNYLDALDAEIRQEPGYKEPVPVVEEKKVLKSATDPDCGYIDQERKKGLGYMSEMTVDTKNGIVIGVDCFPANCRESSIILRHIERIKADAGVSVGRLGLDAGYDVGAVHRGLELLGVTGYVSCIDFSYDILKREAKYIQGLDCFECPAGKRINFVKLAYKKTTRNYYRLYRMSVSDRKCCRSCERFRECELAGSAARICASACYPAFYRNRQRYETAEYKAMKRLRGIWAEGAFAVLKREHNLARAKKRGLHRVTEECLFSAL